MFVIGVSRRAVRVSEIMAWVILKAVSQLSEDELKTNIRDHHGKA
jgi:hypothetical protein